MSTIFFFFFLKYNVSKAVKAATGNQNNCSQNFNKILEKYL